MPAPIHLVFALYPELTQLDFTGPFEVLQRMPGARVSVASGAGGTLRADSGLLFAGLQKLSGIEQCDMICVPGGRGRVAAAQDAEFIANVRRLGLGARYVTSVCTGSLLLGAARLIEGKHVACHWAWRELLGEFGAIPDAGRVVRDGNVITGGGVTAGIDFALSLVAEMAGPDIARAIQLSIEYDPAPPFNAGRPEQAPHHVLTTVCQRISRMYPERAGAFDALLATETQG